MENVKDRLPLHNSVSGTRMKALLYRAKTRAKTIGLNLTIQHDTFFSFGVTQREWLLLLYQLLLKC
jgi:hypothetical protein